MRKLAMNILFGVVCVFLSTPLGVTKATEIVWTFINPSFIGGDPFNGAWLLSSAQAQNSHVEKSSTTYQKTDPLADFEDSLNRQLLSRLATKILDEAFGEETTVPLQPGQYVVGDYTIDVTTNGGINVVITDTITGNQTTIQVPYY